MEILKIIRNGQPYGVYAITGKELEDWFLDQIKNAKSENEKEQLKDLLNHHLTVRPLAVIPESAESFRWNEDIHGKFILND